MAKSIRSQAKKRSKAILRTTVFKPVEDNRLQRLAKKQAEAANEPSVRSENVEEQVPETKAAEGDAAAMAVDQPVLSPNQYRKMKIARKNKYRKGKGKKSIKAF